MIAKPYKKIVRGSLILLIAFNIFNFLNFLFQFIMARVLTAAEYGILAALFAIIYITTIFSESIQTVISKYAAQEHSQGKIRNLIHRSMNKSALVAFILFIVYLFFAIPLSALLKITYPLLALHGLIIFAAFLTPIPRGIMQGKQLFTNLGINLIIESASKIGLAILLVWAFSLFLPSLKIYGAVIAVLGGAALALSLAFIPLKKIMNSREKPVHVPSIYSYSAPIFIATLAVIGFYSIDILVAKAVFSSEVAGYYAIAAVIAKAIFWGTLPVSKAMFPLSSASKLKKRAARIFRNALSILVLCIIAALLIVFIFPDTIISIFSGKNLPESARILGYCAIALSMISLSNLVLLYKISQGITKQYWILAIPLIIEIALLLTFSSSLVQFASALMASSIIFFLTVAIFIRK